MVCFAEIHNLVLRLEPVRAIVIHANVFLWCVALALGDRLISLGTLQASRSP